MQPCPVIGAAKVRNNRRMAKCGLSGWFGQMLLVSRCRHVSRGLKAGRFIVWLSNVATSARNGRERVGRRWLEGKARVCVFNLF